MRKLLNAVFALMFLAGFLLLVYPTIADQWNTYRQSRLISSYEETIAVMEPEDFSEEWEKAEAFNDKLAENNIYGDVFAGDGEDLEDTEYWSVLNAAGDGVMGYISIPKIQVKLSIYHGTSEEVLQTGVGHLDPYLVVSARIQGDLRQRPCPSCFIFGPDHLVGQPGLLATRSFSRRHLGQIISALH